MTILATDSAVVRPGLTPWQAELRDAVRSSHELRSRLRLPPCDSASAGGEADFPVFVPPSFLRRIQPGDPNDPLLRQVLPVEAESYMAVGFSTDPVGDATAKLQPGVLQKYSGRALLITTGVCAVHCRYCFRRHYPYEEAPHSEAAWDQALATVRDDETINEVILSGGDPLMLVDERLAMLVDKIATIPHVATLRIHTRLPIMIPSRVTERMLEWLAGSRLTPVVVIHANHARELSDEVARGLALMRQRKIMLLNQAVLLRDVNDSLEAQVNLSERLIERGVVPYYLHQLDRVAGAAHFEVAIDEGRRIIEAMRRRLPGYAVPKYVQEIAGQPHKVVLA